MIGHPRQITALTPDLTPSRFGSRLRTRCGAAGLPPVPRSITARSANEIGLSRIVMVWSRGALAVGLRLGRLVASRAFVFMVRLIV
jgi:hypothetical protein